MTKKIFEEPDPEPAKQEPVLILDEDDLIGNIEEEIKKDESDNKPDSKVLIVDDEVHVLAKPVEEIEEEDEKPKKKKRAKRPMTEERRLMLIENLKKGRETSMANRKKAAEAKKITKKNKDEAINKIIEEDRKLKETNLMKKDNQLITEFNEMKLMMKKLMDENNKLKTNKQEPPEKLEVIKEIVNEPKNEPKPPTPLRISRSRGIGSRWSRYQR